MAMPAKTKAVFTYLKTCASNMRTVSYQELGRATNIAPIGIGAQLGYIRDEVCRDRGLPWLNALAVSKATWRPGDSFLPALVVVTSADEERLWRGMVLQVFAFDWSEIKI